MMGERDGHFRKSVDGIYRLMAILFAIFGLFALFLVYLMFDPTLSAFQAEEPPLEPILIGTTGSEAYDKIENGIHIRTGFVEGEGMMLVVNNCTNCHSAQLVTQNRMTRDGWKATIKWMQETQNLWDLGNNEEAILDYLSTHYAPKDKGRRQHLENIDWYVLQE
ncbi:MAG: monoheme cytochrome C [Flavobacteriaceae bacterium]